MGIFPQAVCLLTDGRTTLDDVRASLVRGGFTIVKEAAPLDDWQFGGATAIVPYRPDVNGYFAVDVVDQPWPDSMGDPRADPKTFGAWTMGQFGPQAFPGGLARAREHSWNWPAGRTAPAEHRGFVRVRLSYVFGAGEDSPMLPEDRDPFDELEFVADLAAALLPTPGVICYFNPSGEVLRDETRYREYLQAARDARKPPLGLWANVRYFRLDDRVGFMDTVGNGQFDASDVEAVFLSHECEPGDVDHYLRNVTHYLFTGDSPIATGDPIDGPGENGLSWTVEVLDEGLVAPPRRVLRLYPRASAAEIREALARAGRG